MVGEPGSGKTSILAKLSHLLAKSFEVPVLLRFMGTTEQSMTTKSLLTSLLKQLNRLSGSDEPVPSVSLYYSYFILTMYISTAVTY